MGRKLEGLCKDCQIRISSSRVRCGDCHDVYIYNRSPANKTLRDLAYDRKQFKANRYTKVRDHARNIYAKRPCEACGYNKHTEVCHIKPISDFDLDTRISEVNSESNLIRLCLNCHWELDNGHLVV